MVGAAVRGRVAGRCFGSPAQGMPGQPTSRHLAADMVAAMWVGLCARACMCVYVCGRPETVPRAPAHALSISQRHAAQCAHTRVPLDASKLSPCARTPSPLRPPPPLSSCPPRLLPPITSPPSRPSPSPSPPLPHHHAPPRARPAPASPSCGPARSARCGCRTPHRRESRTLRQARRESVCPAAHRSRSPPCCDSSSRGSCTFRRRGCSPSCDWWSRRCSTRRTSRRLR